MLIPNDNSHPKSEYEHESLSTKMDNDGADISKSNDPDYEEGEISEDEITEVKITIANINDSSSNIAPLNSSKQNAIVTMAVDLHLPLADSSSKPEKEHRIKKHKGGDRHHRNKRHSHDNSDFINSPCPVPNKRKRLSRRTLESAKITTDNTTNMYAKWSGDKHDNIPQIDNDHHFVDNELNNSLSSPMIDRHDVAQSSGGSDDENGNQDLARYMRDVNDMASDFRGGGGGEKEHCGRLKSPLSSSNTSQDDGGDTYMGFPQRGDSFILNDDEREDIDMDDMYHERGMQKKSLHNRRDMMRGGRRAQGRMMMDESGRRDDITEHRRCRYFLEGRCGKAEYCQFRHEFNSPRKDELCKFYASGTCRKGDHCTYMHDEFPCRKFHLGKGCNKNNCMYSHDPLTPLTKSVLERFTQEQPFKLDDDCESGDYENFRMSNSIEDDKKNSLLGTPPKFAVALPKKPPKKSKVDNYTAIKPSKLSSNISTSDYDVPDKNFQITSNSVVPVINTHPTSSSSSIPSLMQLKWNTFGRDGGVIRNNNSLLQRFDSTTDSSITSTVINTSVSSTASESIRTSTSSILSSSINETPSSFQQNNNNNRPNSIFHPLSSGPNFADNLIRGNVPFYRLNDNVTTTTSSQYTGAGINNTVSTVANSNITVRKAPLLPTPAASLPLLNIPVHSNFTPNSLLSSNSSTIIAAQQQVSKICNEEQEDLLSAQLKTLADLLVSSVKKDQPAQSTNLNSNLHSSSSITAPNFKGSGDNKIETRKAIQDLWGETDDVGELMGIFGDVDFRVGGLITSCNLYGTGRQQEVVSTLSSCAVINNKRHDLIGENESIINSPLLKPVPSVDVLPQLLSQTTSIDNQPLSSEISSNSITMTNSLPCITLPIAISHNQVAINSPNILSAVSQDGSLTPNSITLLQHQNCSDISNLSDEDQQFSGAILSLPWTLIPCDVPVKIPYPLMTFSSNFDVTKLSNDPRINRQFKPLVGTDTVIDFSSMLHTTLSSVTTGFNNTAALNSSSTNVDKLKDPRLAIRNSYCDNKSILIGSLENNNINNDTNMLNDNNNQPRYKMQLNERAAVFNSLQSLMSSSSVSGGGLSLSDVMLADSSINSISMMNKDNGAGSGKSYLLDPRFRRRKMQVNITASSEQRSGNAEISPITNTSLQSEPDVSLVNSSTVSSLFANTSNTE